MMCSEERHRKTDRQTFTFNWNSRDNPIRCRHDINSNVGGPHILTNAYLGPTKPAFLVFELASRALSASNFQVPTPPTPLSFLSLLSLSPHSLRERDRQRNRERERERAIWNWNPPSSPHCGLFLSLSFWAFHASIPGLCTCVCVCVCVSVLCINYLRSFNMMCIYVWFC